MIDLFIKRLERWSAEQPDIKAVAIVGSYACGTARADSDEQWCAREEMVAGTGKIISEGARIIFDPNFLLANLVDAVREAENTH